MEKVQYILNIDEDLHAKWKKNAAKEHKTMLVVLEEALGRHLDILENWDHGESVVLSFDDEADTKKMLEELKIRRQHNIDMFLSREWPKYPKRG